MYFIKRSSMICHILDDEETGRAPAPCGITADRLTLVNYQSGKPTPEMMEEKPANIPLCKHCQKAEAGMC